MLRAIVIAILLVLPTGTAQAQRQCKIGKPCGNSCIARNKTCHVGTASATTSPATTRGSTSGRSIPVPLHAPAEPSADSMPWVASNRGHTYYQRGCSGADALAEPNRIYFRKAKEAEDAGYQRSRAGGC